MKRVARRCSRRTQFAGGNQKVQGAINKVARARADALVTGRWPWPVRYLDGETLYVGRQTISNDDRDLLVINWQADAAIPYYQASVDEPMGVARVRKFLRREPDPDVPGLVFADLAERVAGLTREERIGVDDALLAISTVIATARCGTSFRRSTTPRTTSSARRWSGCWWFRVDRARGRPWWRSTGSPGCSSSIAGELDTQRRPRRSARARPSPATSVEVLPGLGDEGVASAELVSLAHPYVAPARIQLSVARLKGQAEDGRFAPAPGFTGGSVSPAPKRVAFGAGQAVAIPRGRSRHNWTSSARDVHLQRRTCGDARLAHPGSRRRRRATSRGRPSRSTRPLSAFGHHSLRRRSSGSAWARGSSCARPPATFHCGGHRAAHRRARNVWRGDLDARRHRAAR